MFKNKFSSHYLQPLKDKAQTKA